MADIKRKAQAQWIGDFRTGQGSISSESGVLRSEHYSFGTRFEQKPGTNPDELIAAAHAACYNMALSLTLGKKGYKPQSITTDATCFLTKKEGGFVITKMVLEVQAEVPDLDEATLKQIAEEADKGCPVSNLLREGLTIELHAELK